MWGRYVQGAEGERHEGDNPYRGGGGKCGSKMKDTSSIGRNYGEC